MDTCTNKIDLLFEVSWEVCNKVGGIYTVLSTKARTLEAIYGDRLIFIGTDVWSADAPSPYFIEMPSLLRELLESAMLPDGVDVRAGRWDIPGSPIALLVKFDGMYAGRDAAYGRMWELYGVDSLHSYGDYDEGCAFGRAAAAVIMAIVRASGADPRRVLAHFDEWTTAMGLLELRADMPGVATVFTTHATSIGRSICGNGKPLYSQLERYNGDQMAAELNMQSKHSLEKAAAHAADSFTTVSDVTAREAEVLLGRRPEVTPNGFEPGFVPTAQKYTAVRRAARRRLLLVATALTGVEYADDTFLIITSGRSEYRNKGLDMFLDSMSGLSAANAGRKAIAFIMVPAWSGGARPDLLQNLESGTHSRVDDPYVTHIINNYDDDAVNRRLHQLGNIANDADSAVTAIYVPCYLNGTDGIFDMSYYSLLPGFDLSVFASYYEPWGYTPLESVAFGVPTITTTLAGFGLWAQEAGAAGLEKGGVDVVPRDDDNYVAATARIAADVAAYMTLPAAAVAASRRSARATAAKARWCDFIKYYQQAYCDALAARDARLK